MCSIRAEQSAAGPVYIAGRTAPTLRAKGQAGLGRPDRLLDLRDQWSIKAHKKAGQVSLAGSTVPPPVRSGGTIQVLVQGPALGRSSSD